MQFRFELIRQKKESFPVEYITFVRDTLLANAVTPITLNKDFFSFIRDYVGYSKDQKGSLSLSSYEVMSAMSENGKLKLEKSDKDLVLRTGRFYAQLKCIIDSTDLKKKSITLTYNDNKKLDEIYNENRVLIDNEMNRMFTELSLESELEAVDAVISDKIICDYYMACTLYKNLNGGRKPIENVLFQKMISRVQTPIFMDKVIDTQQFYTQLSGKSLDFTQSLINTSHLKEAKDADALWKELIAPYKGKIIYADFWGTWCGPCKMQMEYVSDIKKQFIGKDVIFMYLANNSPEESWRNVIKSYSLTGDNVVHYRLPDEQQSLLERRFGVKFFPTFMMIDRNGNIVDSKPPCPSQKETTVNYLKGWLEKK